MFPTSCWRKSPSSLSLYLYFLAATENWQDKADQSNHIGEEKVDKATVSDWRVLYHFTTGPWMLERKRYNDDGIDELKETSDGKEDSSKEAFHWLRALSRDELKGGSDY